MHAVDDLVRETTASTTTGRHDASASRRSRSEATEQRSAPDARRTATTQPTAGELGHPQQGRRRLSAVDDAAHQSRWRRMRRAVGHRSVATIGRADRQYTGPPTSAVPIQMAIDARARGTAPGPPGRG